MKFKARMFYFGRRGKIAQCENNFLRARSLPRRKEILYLAPNHLGDQLIVSDCPQRTGANTLTVSQHSETIGDLAHLFQKMTDVDNTDALVLQPANQCKESFHIVALQAAGGLIHKNDAGAS